MEFVVLIYRVLVQLQLYNCFVNFLFYIQYWNIFTCTVILHTKYLYLLYLLDQAYTIGYSGIFLEMSATSFTFQVIFYMAFVGSIFPSHASWFFYDLVFIPFFPQFWNYLFTNQMILLAGSGWYICDVLIF